ncbi:hypothetical protein AB2L28_03975 [Kineococcus sp. TBRC 1896]|uniref:DUF2231 domain-containing protein n=1 Tax=Kineococcus mangrovi TaxID=1660183 RepID=A0ABV4HY92_9ACTN
MEPLTLARTLSVVNTALAGAAVGTAQAVFDVPDRSRRFLGWSALVVAGSAALVASDALWGRATGERTVPPADDVVLAAPETRLLLGHLAVAAVTTPVWIVGRRVPSRLRERGVRRPNFLLGVPLGLGYAALVAGVERTYARERIAALA